MESEFQEGRKKKSFLWGRILEIIKEKVPEFNLSRDQISRKFLNLFCTYKRIKKRNSLTGRAASAWEFFEEFDDVYGTRHSISTPPENLYSSLSLPSTRDASNVVEDIGVSNDSPGTSNKTTSTNLGRRRRTTSANESLEFLKEEAKNEKERHDQIIELEREKMQIERERIQTMASLRDMLQKFLGR